MNHWEHEITAEFFPESVSWRLRSIDRDLRTTILRFPDDQAILQEGVPPDLLDRCNKLSEEKYRIKEAVVINRLFAETAGSDQEAGPSTSAKADPPRRECGSPMIDEKEAARLMKRSPKHLGNLRRRGVIPRTLYQQLSAGAKVMYRREKFDAWLSNHELGRK